MVECLKNKQQFINITNHLVLTKQKFIFKDMYMAQI